MIDTRSLYPFRTRLRNFDEKNGLLLELNNFIYSFLSRSLMFRGDFAEKIWTSLLMRPLQEKESYSPDIIFAVLKEIYDKKDIPSLYAYIELLYDSLDELSKKVSAIPTFASTCGSLNKEFETGINNVLTRFNTGLLLCSGLIVDGIEGTAAEEIQIALEEPDTASKSIRSALKAISMDGPEDADLCVREATCAVEYTIKKRLNANTLTDGIGKLRATQSKHVIHGALLKSLENFYGCASDTARHSAVKPLTLEEARLALSLSAAWVNYLRKVLP